VGIRKPKRGFPSKTFESSLFDHSATSPCVHGRQGGVQQIWRLNGAVSGGLYSGSTANHWLASHWVHGHSPTQTQTARGPPPPRPAAARRQGWNPARCRSSHQRRIRSRDRRGLRTQRVCAQPANRPESDRREHAAQRWRALTVKTGRGCPCSRRVKRQAPGSQPLNPQQGRCGLRGGRTPGGLWLPAKQGVPSSARH